MSLSSLIVIDTKLIRVSQEYSFGVELKYESKVKGAQKKTLVSSDNIGHVQIKSELPLKNGCTCVVVERLTTQEEDGEVLMHQVQHFDGV